MTQHELHKILKIPFYKRKSQKLQIFEWEHFAKSFYKIPNDLALEHLIKMFKYDDPMILKCENNCEPYYFGIGLKDCDNIALKKLKELYKHGTWYVYTWSD